MPPTKAGGGRKKAAAPRRRPAKSSRASKPSRSEQARRERERRSLKRRLVVAVVLIIGLGAFVFFTRADEDAVIIDEIEASGACSYDTVTDGDPPAEGDVEGTDPAEPGFYEGEDELPSDLSLIRSMRQGFVVLWYEAAASPDEARGLSERFGRDLIVVPRPGMPVPVAATAWGRRVMCSSFDEAALARFTDAFRDHGPEKGFL